MNFDGFMDITVEQPQEGDNIRLIFFLYNPNTQKYEYNETLSELTGLQSDPETKTLTEWINFSAEGDYWRMSEYRWEGTNLVMFRSTLQERDYDIDMYKHEIDTLQPDGTWSKTIEYEPIDEER